MNDLFSQCWLQRVSNLLRCFEMGSASLIGYLQRTQLLSLFHTVLQIIPQVCSCILSCTTQTQGSCSSCTGELVRPSAPWRWRKGRHSDLFLEKEEKKQCHLHSAALSAVPPERPMRDLIWVISNGSALEQASFFAELTAWRWFKSVIKSYHHLYPERICVDETRKKQTIRA